MGLVLPLALLTSLRLALHHPGNPGGGGGHLSPAQLQALGLDAADTRATIQQRGKRAHMVSTSHIMCVGG
jgi:hypothetical protein